MRGVGIAASALLIAIAVALAVVGRGNDGRSTSDPGPLFIDRAGLVDLEADLGHPVYWAGERPGLRIELDEDDRSVYLRYLPAGVSAGDPRVGFLTVGTYPVADAVAALRRVAEDAGVELQRADDDGAILPNPASAGSVYLAYPGTGIQIEVYDPAAGKALRLIRSGAIEPVGG